MSRFKFEQRLTSSANFRSLFKYINKYNNNSQNIKKILDSNGSCIENPQDISNVFNKYFILVFYNDSTFPCKLTYKKTNTSSFFHLSFVKPCFVINKNKNYKGPDGIPASVYVNLFDVFGAFYTQMFNTFYNENYIRETWKFLVITPLYKNSDLVQILKITDLYLKPPVFQGFLKRPLKLNLKNMLLRIFPFVNMVLFLNDLRLKFIYDV